MKRYWNSQSFQLFPSIAGSPLPCRLDILGSFPTSRCAPAERDLVRRWTGGEIIFRGEDLTYSIVIPRNDPAFEKSSIAIYEGIHLGLAHALNGLGQRAQVVGSARYADWTPRRSIPDQHLLRESSSRRCDDGWPQDRRRGATPYSSRFVTARQYSRHPHDV